jgi:3-phenylpropionate/trans-cinnamate dioxygenase ferredoxin reductase subunit
MASNSERAPFAIVGSGLAAAKAAEALRAEGADGRIVVLAGEPRRPHHRPPLSEDFLRGETPRADVFVHPAEWARAPGVELYMGKTAALVEVGSRSVALGSGESIAFERLLIVTGASPRPLAIPGGDLDGLVARADVVVECAPKKVAATKSGRSTPS